MSRMSRICNSLLFSILDFYLQYYAAQFSKEQGSWFHSASGKRCKISAESRAFILSTQKKKKKQNLHPRHGGYPCGFDFCLMVWLNIFKGISTCYCTIMIDCISTIIRCELLRAYDPFIVEVFDPCFLCILPQFAIN
ncbi:hypothetical protein Ancab_000240 [Ancistrocladus abbreviatus]